MEKNFKIQKGSSKQLWEGKGFNIEYPPPFYFSKLISRVIYRHPAYCISKIEKINVMCKYWTEGLRNLIAELTKYRIFFAYESRTFHLIYFTHSVWLHITHWLAGPQRSPAASLLWLSVSGLDQKGQRKQHRVFIQGQGHSAGLERTEPSPTRRNATLMKGYAAWRPGYTDHGLIGLMRCSSS